MTHTHLYTQISSKPISTLYARDAINMLYARDEVENRIREDYGVFLLDDFYIKRLEDRHKRTYKYNREYIEEDLLISVLSDVSDRSDVSRLWLLDIKKRLASSKRRYSTSHRIEIAYKSLYKCNMCCKILPPTFEVDHIVELHEGGEDAYENLQALCPNCHAKKTRANVLKRDKLFEKHFGARSTEMVSRAFDNFKRVKRSKYF